MKQCNRSPGRGHILIGALVALATIAASQRPLALTGSDLLVVSAVTLLSLGAGLGVRLLLSRTRRKAVFPPPHFAPRAIAEEAPRVERRRLNGDEQERDSVPSKATSAPRAAIPERRPRDRSARRHRSRAAKRLAGASKG